MNWNANFLTDPPTPNSLIQNAVKTEQEIKIDNSLLNLIGSNEINQLFTNSLLSKSDDVPHNSILKNGPP